MSGYSCYTCRSCKSGHCNNIMNGLACNTCKGFIDRCSSSRWRHVLICSSGQLWKAMLSNGLGLTLVNFLRLHPGIGLPGKVTLAAVMNGWLYCMFASDMDSSWLVAPEALGSFKVLETWNLCITSTSKVMLMPLQWKHPLTWVNSKAQQWIECTWTFSVGYRVYRK